MPSWGRRSGPARGLWIEIAGFLAGVNSHSPSGPARGLWIEITLNQRFPETVKSGPARGLWIEISAS